MFEFIRGTLYSKGIDYCVIDVGGMGYRILTSISTLNTLGPIGETITVHTHLHVKEDGITLFGFSTHEELSVFMLLISVSGVGPKGALGVLSILTPSQFSLAIVTGDHKTISKSKGVGSKMSQRIILELKDKIKKDMSLYPMDGIVYALGDNGEPEEPDNEAISALLVLGFSMKEAAGAVAAVSIEGMALEDIVKMALKRLMR